MLEKGFEFISSRENGAVAFYLGFMLLSAKINPLTEKRGRKKNALMACNIGRIEMVLVMSTKVVVLYLQVSII